MKMDIERDDSCEGIETAAADTTSDSSIHESPGIHSSSADHYHWIHHSSGRMLPVGIAHPLKNDCENDSEPEELEEILKGPSSKGAMSLHRSDHGSSSKEDQSSDNNEEQNASSSDTADSSSSTSDENEDDDSQEVQMSLRETLKRANRDENVIDSKPKIVMKSPYKGEPISHSHSYSRSTMLPPGKEWHLFVSHSTADKDMVRERVVVPMREQYHFKVKASYHCMPDAGRYDDKTIQRDMHHSCIIMTTLSPPYLSSSRCENEWKLAVKLNQSGVCNVVVSAFGVVSRPLPLKSFTYLDYMDKSKRENVIVKLQLEIGNFVKPRLPQDSPSSPPRGHHEKVEVPTPLKPDPLGLESNQPFKSRLPARTSDKHNPTPYTEQEHNESENDYEDQHCKRLEEEFEAEYDYTGQEEEEGYHGETEQRPADTTDSGESENEVSSDDESEREEYNAEFYTLQENLSQRGKKRKIEDMENKNRYLQQEELSWEGKKRSVKEDGEVEDSDGNDSIPLEQPGNAAQVASFYNTLAEPNLESRSKSRIFHMRNFNNWVKSVLIRTYLDKIQKAHVLDLCCGKGGDLLKWKEGGISYLVGADIAATSIEQCKSRYGADKMKTRHGGRYFEAEFHVADCTQVRLRNVYHNPGMRFNITSCQFSLHYCFESLVQAEVMLQNLCENLRPGGYFIGTTVDSNELVHRFRNSIEENHMCGNSIYSAVPLFDLNDVPLFGAKYNFHLEGVVDVPEYLIHFPLLERMLKAHNMHLILKESFHDFFHSKQPYDKDMELLYRMQALNKETGRISEEEWEAIGLYLVFAFQKYNP